MKVRESSELSVYVFSSRTDTPQSTIKNFEGRNEHLNLRYLAKAIRASGLTWKEVGALIDEVVFTD